jgi:hypothetical protein
VRAVVQRRPCEGTLASKRVSAMVASWLISTHHAITKCSKSVAQQGAWKDTNVTFTATRMLRQTRIAPRCPQFATGASSPGRNFFLSAPGSPLFECPPARPSEKRDSPYIRPLPLHKIALLQTPARHAATFAREMSRPVAGYVLSMRIAERRYCFSW